MIEDTNEGKTFSCTHENTNESGICDKCLGKEDTQFNCEECDLLECTCFCKCGLPHGYCVCGFSEKDFITAEDFEKQNKCCDDPHNPEIVHCANPCYPRKITGTELKQEEQAELSVFWQAIASHLPKSFEREAFGEDKILQAFKAVYPEMRRFLNIKFNLQLIEIEKKVNKIYFEKYAHFNREYNNTDQFRDFVLQAIKDVRDE